MWGVDRVVLVIVGGIIRVVREGSIGSDLVVEFYI
jgi:hypothetical protein